MVKLIKTIDAIARERRADVIFLATFDDNGRHTREHPAIMAATMWLTDEGIRWELCGGFQTGWISLEGGPRVIFIDVPHEPGSGTLKKLEARFESGDGSPRIPGLILTLLTLDEAMENAEQDNPEFWDNF
jgi:hypothetical protein